MEVILGLLWMVGWTVICAVIAQSKGHSGCNGAVGGCLFGVFALIYWLIAKDKNREQQEYQYRHSQWQHDMYMKKMAEMQTQHQAEIERQLNEFRDQRGQTSKEED